MTCSRWPAALLPAAAILCSVPARGDVPDIAPPRLVHEERAEYPARAALEHLPRTTVTLVLVVDSRGAVANADVETPQGHGFDQAALEAASRLVFEPATRDGVPVSVRIRFRYVFDPLPDVHALTSVPAPQPAAPPVAAEQSPLSNESTEAPEEVIVKGSAAPNEPTHRKLTAEEIHYTAGGRGDALVSLESLPGVGHAPPFNGLLILRGSAPEDTHVYVDGTDVPLIYHLGGLSSVLPTEALDRLDLFPGNFDAAYGRGMGGVVEAAVRDPRGDGRFHGIAQLDSLEGRVLTEGPIGAGLNFLAAARRSTFDLWLNPISGPGALDVRYYDAQAEIQKEFDARCSLRFLFFGADDRLDQTLHNAGLLTGNVGVHTSFWRAQVRFVDRYSSSGQLRIVAAVGQDVTEQAFGPFYVDVTQTPVSARAELEEHVLSWASVRIGVDVLHGFFRGAVLAHPFSDPDQPDAGPAAVPLHVAESGAIFTPGAYVAGALSPWPGVRLVPALRVDYDDATGALDVAPRINVLQKIPGTSGATTLKAGAGEYFQPPGLAEVNDVFGQPGLKSNRSVHYDVGIEERLSERIDLTMDLWGKSMDRLVVPGARNSGQGRAYGAEWLLRWAPGGPFFGWIAYTLSRSERRDSPEARWHLFDFDQTHNLSVVASWKIDERWRLGARFRFVSGDPYTPSSYGAFDTDAAAYQPVAPAALNSARTPPLHELDLRLDRSWQAGPVRVTAYVDIQNVYSYQAPVEPSYNYNFTRHGYLSGFPILPGIGLRGEL
jgi:TonB family protein